MYLLKGFVIELILLLLTLNVIKASKETGSAGEVDISDGTLPPVNEPPNATAILDKMFVNYDKRLRPMYGVEPVQIYLSMGFLSISHVVEENMEFKGDLFLRQFWKDPRLVYGDKNSTLILQGDILKKLWFPDTYVENSKKITIHEDTKTVVLFGDGNVFYSVRVTIDAMGFMDFRHYPMDVQSFFFRAISYGFDLTQIRYKWIEAELYSTDMAEFYVMNQTLSSGKVKYMLGWFYYLDVSFYVRRRIGHYVIRIFFPCILCTVVSWLPFWMDRREIGDRGALGITTLLTEVFLLQYTNANMPRVSYVKAADLFLIVSFAFTFLALIESVIVYNYKKKSQKSEDTQVKGSTGERRLFRKLSKVAVQEVPKTDTIIDGSHINPVLITEAFTETPSPLAKPPPLTTKLWEKPRNQEEKDTSLCSTASAKSKIQGWFASYKGYLSKQDLSYFIEISSRFAFPAAYIIFIVYFFAKYGI